MKISTYHSYDELPLFLNAELVAKVLGVSISSAYELMHEEVFPSVRIGSRFVVHKDKFQQWVERQTGGARCEPGQSTIRSRTIFLCPMRSISWVCLTARSLSTVTCSASKTAEPTSAIPATPPSAMRWE